jgi:hypothetical protein
MTMIIDGTNGLTFPDTSKQYNSYYNFKNRIINGAMVIDQRNAGASITANDDTYGVDRFKTAASQSSKLTAQRNAGAVTPPAEFSNYLGYTSSSAYSVGSSDYFVCQQGIEGFNMADLGWGAAGAQTITLSFWVRSSLTGTFGGSLRNASADRSYPFTYTISAANTWEKETITIAGDTSGTWGSTNGIGISLGFGLGVGSTLSGTAGAWAGANYRSATGATSVVGTNGATFYITGVQLEKGTQATSFDYRPYGTELALCQRYYWRFKANNNVSIFSTGLNTGTTAARHVLPFPVPMRAAPSSLEQSGTASDYRLWHGSGTTTNLSAVPAFDTATEYNGHISLTVASGLTGGGFSMMIANTGTAGYLGWSAEL